MGCATFMEVGSATGWTCRTPQAGRATLMIEGGTAAVMGWARRRPQIGWDIIRSKRAISVESGRRGRPYIGRRTLVMVKGFVIIMPWMSS